MDRRYPVRQARLACRPVMALGVGLAVCTAGWAAPQTGDVTGTASSICQSPTHPGLAARLSNGILAALRGRSSAVGLTVDDRVTRMTCTLHPHWHIESASVVKVTILSALLRKLQEQHRTLSAQQQKLATAMITMSDNNAASTLWAETGPASMQRFLNLAGMRETQLGQDGFWGLTQITAHDELTLLKLLTSRNTVLSAASCSYVLNLMARVIPSQRWGVPAGAPTNVTVHVKNGWLPQPTHGWRIHSIGSFSGHGRDYMIVVLTWNNPTMTYGVNTVQAVAQVINRALNPGATSVIPPTKPYPSWGTPDEQIPAPLGRT
jgi:Beta-lactamase enzyme family